MKPAASLVCLTLGLTALLARAQSPLPRSLPEAQGVSSARLLRLVESLDRMDTMNSLMVVRHGRVVAEGWWTPYQAESPHEMYSLSKSFTSTAVGFAVAEGRLGVFDEVLKFFPDEVPDEPSANLKAMRVRDLLTMSTGHQDEPPSRPAVVSPESFLAHPVPHKPGTHFKYNTPATFMQSAIVQKVTGQTVLDYLKPRLFEPLGISGMTWDSSFQGIHLGGYGLKVRTEDIAKLGQLYLQGGNWNGRQLLPEAWVADATSRQVSNGSNPNSDWDQGYGYQFWRCRHGAFRGDGAFGQYCVVLPEQDAVVAVTSGIRDMQGVLNILWDELLPALGDHPLPEDPAAAARLRERLQSLSIRFPDGDITSPTATKVAGRRFSFDENPQQLKSVSVVADGTSDGVTLVFESADSSWRIPSRHHAWVRSRGPFGSGLSGAYTDEALAASHAWADDGTLMVKQVAVETPFYATLRLKFDGDSVTFTREVNVGFGGTRESALTGTAR